MDEQPEKTDLSTIAWKAVDLVENSIRSLHPERRAIMPSILNLPGKWVASYSTGVLAILYLNNAQIERVVECNNKNINPFAGFIAPEGIGSPVAINVSGTNNVFVSNSIANMYSFKVSPEASFIVLNHTQELTDSSGEKMQYTVDLALVLGLREKETWDSLAVRLLQLFDYFEVVWLRDHGTA